MDREPMIDDDDAGPLNTFNGWPQDHDLYRSAARAADLATIYNENDD